MQPRRVELAPPGYEVIRELGRGGLGVVVLARHTSLDRLCAVKRLLANPDVGADVLARFRREARAQALLDHPAVVRLHDAVSADGALFLVMEYVDGHDLRGLLDGDGLHHSAYVGVLADVAAALDHAGGRGIVHRDVKPGNVFVMRDGRAKLGDFGIARILGDADVFQSVAGSVTGSLPYMAPEQILGGTTVGPPADVYGFCVMAYEVTVGRTPFNGSAEQIIEGHLLRSADRPDAIVAGYPQRFADVLMAGLAKEPEHRPDMREVAATLATIDPAEWPVPPRDVVHRDQPVATTVAPPTATPAAPRTKAADLPVAAAVPDAWVVAPVFEPPSTPARQQRRPLVAVVAVAAAVLGLIVAALLREHGEDTIAVRTGDASITVDRASGHCPASTFEFDARLMSNGSAGTIRVQWTGLDGLTRAPITISAAKGVKEVHTALDFTVSGSQALRGAPTLHILAPTAADVAGPEVAYTCP